MVSAVTTRWTRLSPKGTPPHSRSSHGVSLVDGRKLMVFGGEAVARTPINSTMHIVDDVDDDQCQWRAVETTEVPPRVAHTQAVVSTEGSTVVYVFGGRQGITMEEAPLNDLWAFNVATEKWAKVTDVHGDVPEPRSFHAMCAVGSTLFVFGGCSAKGRLSDLCSFNTVTRTWKALPTPESFMIRGRGGASLLPDQDGNSLWVLSGFAGEETADIYKYSVKGEAEGTWSEYPAGAFRPRSVCCGVTLPTSGRMVLFGGEVDPSAKGHEGAGAFANDSVVVAKDGSSVVTVPGEIVADTNTSKWPATRGWSSAASRGKDGVESLFVFGGLSGDDASPLRLGDLWRGDYSSGTCCCSSNTTEINLCGMKKSA